MHLFARVPVLLALAASAHAASFNCSLAKSPREKTVCADKKLSALDSRMTGAYTSLLHVLSLSAASQVRSDQRAWLHWLDQSCPPGTRENVPNSTNCLTNAYNQRLSELTVVRLSSQGPVFFPRSFFGYTREDDAKDLPPGDPGFGTCEFVWPQLDSTTAEAAAWNAAAYKTASVLSRDEDDKPPISFETRDCKGGTIELLYDFRAVSPRFIDVSFLVSTYGYGAAHPLTSRSSFLWLLEQRRELKVTDVLRSGSAANAIIVPLLVARLQKLEGMQEMGADKAALTEDTTKELQVTDEWTVSRSGLMLTFGQYEVGAYALGMPTVCASWQEIAPALNPTFAFEGLPPLLPPSNGFVPSCPE